MPGMEDGIVHMPSTTADRDRPRRSLMVTECYLGVPEIVASGRCAAGLTLFDTIVNGAGRGCPVRERLRVESTDVHLRTARTG